METETENIPSFPCKACMQYTTTMYPLFEEYEAGISMASILQPYLPYKINENTNFPNELCEDCAVILIKFHNFIVMYRDTQNKFNKLLCSKNDEANQEIDNEEIILNNEQIIIQSIGTEEDNNYTLQIKSERDLVDVDESEDLLQSDENCIKYIKIETEEEEEEEGETINISFEDDNEENELNDDKTEEVTQYHCPLCNDVFLYMEMLTSHINKNHNIYKFEGSTSTTVIKRRVFEDDDDDDPDYIDYTNPINRISYGIHSCKLCGKSFPTVKSLHIHEGSHKRNKNYSILCDKNFDAENQFICDICGRGFRKKAYLNDHVEIHDTIRKLHNCPICQKQFKGRSNFARHKRFHFQDKRQHICEVCGMAFNLRSTLKTHFYLKHIRERNFQCLICSRFFSLKSTLEKHVRRHQHREGSAQPEKFPCYACDMKYLDKSSLKRHIELKHSADKAKYECTDCDKDYTTFTNLAKHRIKKHPGKQINVGRKRDFSDIHELDRLIAVINVK